MSTAVASKSSATSARPRSIETSRGVPAPPAIWAAMARQGRWKSWALALSLFLNVFLAFAMLGFAAKEPDVVLVAETGKSTYLDRSIAGEELLRYLQERRGEPTDVTVVHFTRGFLKTLLAVNSSTIDAAWPEALAMMAPELRGRMQKEADDQKLIATYRAAQVATELRMDGVKLVERQGNLVHLSAEVSRRRVSLVNPQLASEDRLEVTLIERIVPRTPARPDGLEVVEYRNRVLPPATGATSAPVAEEQP